MIRLAKPHEIPRLLEIYDSARAFMRQKGNLVQWQNGYPDAALLQADIAAGNLYVMEDETHIYGCFALIAGDDPTYAKIDGAWLSDAPYGTIHRIAGDGTRHGIFAECVSYAEKRFDHLRVDTHADNHPMQRAVLREGFSYQGIIYLENGSPRLGYERIR